MSTSASERDRVPIDGPTLRLFLLSGFVWQLCWSSYWTLFFVRVVVDVGLDPLELLLLGTTKEVTILLVEIPTGVVADIRSRRLSVIIAFVMCGAAVVGAGIAPTFGWLVLTQIVWSAGTTFRSGAETAWFTDEVGSVDVVDRVLPRRGRIEAVGSVVGLLAMSALAAVAGLTAAMIVIGAILIAFGFVLVAQMPETGFERHEASATVRARSLLGEGLAAARRPGLRVLLIAAIMAGFASEAVDRLHVARLDEIGLQDGSIDPALLIGLSAVLTSLGAIAILWFARARLAGRGLVDALTVLHLVTGIGVLVLARAELLTLALAGFIAQGMTRSVSRTVTVAWTNHFTVSSNRATVHSFMGQAGSLGEITGGIGLGLLANTVGIRAAITASATIYVGAAAVAHLGRRRWSEPAAEAPG